MAETLEKRTVGLGANSPGPESPGDYLRNFRTIMNDNTTTKRVQLLRKRRAEQGLTRLDIYARPEDHEKIKEFVRQLTLNQEPEKKEENVKDKLARQAEEARENFYRLMGKRNEI